jgi:hypothetical protein
MDELSLQLNLDKFSLPLCLSPLLLVAAIPPFLPAIPQLLLLIFFAACGGVMPKA